MSLRKLVDKGIAIDDLIEIPEQFSNYIGEIDVSIAESVNRSDENNFKTYLKHSVLPLIVLNSLQSVEIFSAINSLNQGCATHGPQSGPPGQSMWLSTMAGQKIFFF